jgi:hypothetical protein
MLLWKLLKGLLEFTKAYDGKIIWFKLFETVMARECLQEPQLCFSSKQLWLLCSFLKASL